ncbi:MAG: hypothetical protein ABGW81_00275 [Paracoccaceae bacterium]
MKHDQVYAVGEISDPVVPFFFCVEYEMVCARMPFQEIRASPID